MNEVANRGKRVHFPLTPSREYTLVNHIFLEKGHLRTDTNMIDKFNNNSLKLRQDSAFDFSKSTVIFGWTNQVHKKNSPKKNDKFVLNKSGTLHFD